MQVGGQNYSQDASGFWTKDSDLSGPYVWDGAAMNLAGIGPADLFLNGEKGVWFDPSDLSTMYQDNIGSIPVTGVEQPVGFIVDKSQGLVVGASDRTNFTVITDGAGVPATYNPATGVGQVTRIDVTNKSGIRKAGLLANTWYRLNITNTSAQTISIRQNIGASVIATVPAAATINVWFNTFTYQDITINAGGDGITNTFVLNSLQQVPGNHASQATTASRPVVKARYNLLLKSEDFSDVAWAKTDTIYVAGSDLQLSDGRIAQMIREGSAGTASMYQQLANIALTGHKIVRKAKRVNHDWLRYVLSDVGSTNGVRVWVNLATGTIGTIQPFGATPFTGVTATATQDADGIITTTINFTPTVTTIQCYSVSATADAATARVANSFRYEVNADLRLAADAALNIPAYQRVNTATDYDTVGFPYYLAFDGVDDSFATGNIDLSAVDEVSMFVGLNKGDDSAVRAVVEFTSNSSSVPGSFAFFAPPATTSPSVQFRSAGTQPTVIAQSGNTLSAPSNNVFTGHAKIATPIVNLRTDGVQTSTANGTQGTGNYANAPLYIGRRANASLPLAGRIYSLIIRAALPSTSVMKQIERYVGNKMGKVL